MYIYICVCVCVCVCVRVRACVCEFGIFISVCLHRVYNNTTSVIGKDTYSRSVS